MDENSDVSMNADMPEPKKARAKKKPEAVVQAAPRKATPKKKKRVAVAPARSKSVSPDKPYGVMVGVCILLGILVLLGTFYAGYLTGKYNAGPEVETGSVETGKLQIIAYSDYECPFCSRVEPTIAQVRDYYGDKVEVVYKNFPLESIHPRALPAAIAAECAEDQGEEQFWQYHDKLFANQQALQDADLKKYDADLKLDTAKFNKCYDGKETEARVRADQQEALGRGVQGTPSFWIKDELFVGAQPFASFQQKIDEKLAGKAAAPAPPPSAPPAPQGKVDVATGSNVMGDADAKVTIVEFSDFQCPFCARFYQQTEGQLVTEYVKTGKVKIAYRHFPLGFHAQAQKAAEASECAADQGKFWEYHDILFTKGQGDGTGLAIADLKQYAVDLKLDTAKFNTCLDGGSKASIVQKDMADGQAAGTSGTPSFYINGQQLVGAQPFANFKAMIDAELAK